MMNLRKMLGALAMVALVALPLTADAQRRQEDRRNDDRYQNNNQRNSVERLVNKAERASNEFRRNFERNWDKSRERGWSKDWDRDWTRGNPGRDRDRNGYGGNQGRDDDRYGDRGNQGRDNGYHGGNQSQDRAWDRDSRYGRRYSPKDAIQRLDEGLEKLRIAVNRDRRDSNYRDYQVGRDEMMEVVRAADNVDFYFGRNRNYNSTLDRQWAQVRTDIEALARFYNLRSPFGRW